MMKFILQIQIIFQLYFDVVTFSLFELFFLILTNRFSKFCSGIIQATIKKHLKDIQAQDDDDDEHHSPEMQSASEESDEQSTSEHDDNADPRADNGDNDVVVTEAGTSSRGLKSVLPDTEQTRQTPKRGHYFFIFFLNIKRTVDIIFPILFISSCASILFC